MSRIHWKDCESFFCQHQTDSTTQCYPGHIPCERGTRIRHQDGWRRITKEGWTDAPWPACVWQCSGSKLYLAGSWNVHWLRTLLPGGQRDETWRNSALCPATLCCRRHNRSNWKWDWINSVHYWRHPASWRDQGLRYFNVCLHVLTPSSFLFYTKLYMQVMNALKSQSRSRLVGPNCPGGKFHWSLSIALFA